MFGVIKCVMVFISNVCVTCFIAECLAKMWKMIKKILYSKLSLTL